MQEAVLTLVSHALCPFVQRAASVLHEKGVQFERVDIDLASKPDWFLAISPLGKVPLLRVSMDDGSEAVLFESAVICEYLEETQPGPRLHPSDPILRAQHRAWAEFASATLGDNWGFLNAKDKEAAEAKKATVRAKFERLESSLGAGPFFGGAAFSMVDAAFAPVFRYYDVLSAEVAAPLFADLPKVSAWRSVLMAHPSVAAAVKPDFADRFTDHLRDAGTMLGRPDLEKT